MLNKSNIKSVLAAFFLGLLICFALPSNAAHIVGANISYENVGKDSFMVRLQLLNDCDENTNIGTNQVVTFHSASCNSTFTATLGLFSQEDITPACPGFTSSCSGSGSLPLSIESYIFESLVVLPAGSCPDWVISWKECCRSSSITTGAANLLLYIETTLNQAISPQNNSPELVSDIYQIGYANQPATFNFHATDPDGDSLVYELITPKQDVTKNAGYLPPYSKNYPFSTTSGSLNFDAVSGMMKATPSASNTTVVGVKVSEYRSGNLIGSMQIDYQLIIFSFGNSNPPPTVHGIDSSGIFTYQAYPGDTVKFKIPTSDPNPFQQVQIQWDQSIPGANFTTDAAQYQNGYFEWIVDSSHVKATPYVFVTKVWDDGCLAGYYGLNYYDFKIYVHGQDSIDVWPGDANNDFVANNLDLFNIGLGYGATGPYRVNATSNWTGQPAQPWINVFNSGDNYKFADGDGNGVIDSNDAKVILQNYGFTHNKTNSGSENNGPLLTINFLEDSVMVGDTVVGDVILGTDSFPVSNFYALAFTLNYDGWLIDSGSFKFEMDTSWVGKNEHSLINIYKDIYPSNKSDIGFTRINQTNRSGYGPVGKISFRMKDDIAGKKSIVSEQFLVSVSQIAAISHNGAALSLDAKGDSLVVYDTEIGSPFLKSEIKISLYPNPTSSEIQVNIENLWANKVILRNFLGQPLQEIEIKPENYQRVRMHLSALPRGVYFIEIVSDDQKIYKQLIKE